jgi:hypothetical protein
LVVLPLSFIMLSTMVAFFAKLTVMPLPFTTSIFGLFKI